MKSKEQILSELIDALQMKEAELIALQENIGGFEDTSKRLYDFACNLITDLIEEIQGLEQDIVELIDGADIGERAELETMKDNELSINPYVRF
jgi:hypothetical protein